MTSGILSPSAAGLRDKLVSVYRLKLNATLDAAGHLNESDSTNWEIFTKQWCGILPRGSREFFRGEQVAADITHQVEMVFNRESSAITTKMRIEFSDKFRTRTMNIAEPPRNAYEMDHTLIFACTEIK